VQDGILLYEERLGNNGGKGETHPVHINSLYKRNIRYLPDGHFKTRIGKVRIYEVLDDELHDQNLIIADIIQAFLTENVSFIQFVVPNAEAENKVTELAVTIYDRLVQMGISQRDLRQVRVMSISRDEATDKESVANHLRSVAKELQDTVDLAVVGGFLGRAFGDRPYRSLLLAAYDPDDDAFRTVCECASGFTDEDMKALPKLLERYRLDHRHPRVDSKINPDVWFVPQLVLELVGTRITQSFVHTTGTNRNRQGKGLTLKFPRFTGRYRTEKSAEDSTTVGELVEMHRIQTKEAHRSE
jgi:hypothetical protein